MHKRFFALDGIRGYAAFAVLVYHAILLYDSSLITRILDVPLQSIPGAYDKLIRIVLTMVDGQIAVLIFFTLSGLVLSIALHKSVLHNLVLVNFEFILKRIARIYPTLIVSVTLFWASFVLLNQLNPDLFQRYAPKDLLNNALLINPVINGATWTLQVEILAIPFILLCFILQKQFGLKGLTILLCYAILTLDNPILRIPIFPSLLYKNLAPFICGFLIASEQAESFFMKIGKDKRFLMLVFCGLFFVHLLTRPLSSTSILIQLFCVSIFLGEVYYRQFTPLLKILESRPSVYLGKISYSFYLNNVIFMYIFHAVFVAYFPVQEHPLEFGLLTTAISAVFTIVLSYITEKYVEQPSIKLGKVITSLFSLVEKKYFMPSILNVAISASENLPNITTEDKEISQEKG